LGRSSLNRIEELVSLDLLFAPSLAQISEAENRLISNISNAKMNFVNVIELLCK
jgi:hypothetical protein